MGTGGKCTTVTYLSKKLEMASRWYNDLVLALAVFVPEAVHMDEEAEGVSN